MVKRGAIERVLVILAVNAIIWWRGKCASCGCFFNLVNIIFNKKCQFKPGGVCVGSSVGPGVATVVVPVVVSGRGVVIPGGNPFSHLLREALTNG